MAAIAPEHEDRLSRPQVGQLRRVGLKNVQAAPVDSNVGELSAVDAVRDPADQLARVVAETDDGGIASTLGGHAVDQVLVGRRADAERPEAQPVARPLAHLADDLGLVADVAVAQQHHDADPLRVGRVLEHGANAFEHLRAAAAAQRAGEAQGALHVLLRCRHVAREQSLSPGGERHHLDAIFRLGALEEALHDLAHLRRRLARHRARHVDEEADLPGRSLGQLLVELLGLEHQQERAVTVGWRVGEQPDLGALAGHGVAQHEVFVGQRVGGGDIHVGALGVESRGLHLMVRRHEILDPHPGVESHLEAHVVTRPSARAKRLRGDAGGIGDACRVRRPTRAARWRPASRLDLTDSSLQLGGRLGGGRFWRPGNEARPDDHREAELVGARVVGEQVDVADLDLDAAAGRDVGHALGEDVGPFLLQQAGRGAARHRVLVDEPCVVAPLDHSDDAPCADQHRHLIDGCGAREGEDVDRLDRLVQRVDEGLLHAHAGDEARYLSLDRSVLQRTLDELAFRVGDAQRTLSDVLGQLEVTGDVARRRGPRKAECGEQWNPDRSGPVHEILPGARRRALSSAGTRRPAGLFRPG